MAKNISFTRKSANSTDQFGRVHGNQYRYSGNGKTYQLVPETMISLPEGNAFIVMRKTQYLNSTNPATGEKNRAVYVYGYSNIKDNNGGFKHTQTLNRQGQPRVRRYYFVARLIFRGGRPNLALYRYMGYNQMLAKQVFAEIPCDEALYLNANGNWVPYRKSKITSKDIVAASIRRAENLEKMKTAAYGNKEARRAWAKANIRQ